MSYDLKILNGDLSIKNADLSTITGKDKLIQDLLKIALTTAGSNTLQPWYGSLISQTLIGSYLNSNIVISVARSQLQNAIKNLQNLQNLQVQSGQATSPDEMIAFVSDISINRNTIDPKLFSLLIKVLNLSFVQFSSTFTDNNTKF